MRWLLIALTALAAPASADYVDGNNLYRFLQGTVRMRGGDMESKEYESGMGQGYVMGVQDSFNAEHFCVPPSVKSSQAEEITFNYLKAHPEKRHEAAKNLVIGALREKFPCRKEANPK